MATDFQAEDDLQREFLVLMRAFIEEKQERFVHHPKYAEFMRMRVFANWMLCDRIYIQESVAMLMINSQLDEWRIAHSTKLSAVATHCRENITSAQICAASATPNTTCIASRMPIIRICSQVFALISNPMTFPGIDDVVRRNPDRCVEEIILMENQTNYFMFVGRDVANDQILPVLAKVFPNYATATQYRRGTPASGWREIIVGLSNNALITGEQFINANAKIKCLCLSRQMIVHERTCEQLEQMGCEPNAIVLAHPECADESIIFVSRKIMFDGETATTAQPSYGIRFVATPHDGVVADPPFDQQPADISRAVAQNESAAASLWIDANAPGTMPPGEYHALYVAAAKARNVRHPLAIQVFSRLMIKKGYSRARTTKGRQWAPPAPPS